MNHTLLYIRQLLDNVLSPEATTIFRGEVAIVRYTHPITVLLYRCKLWMKISVLSSKYITVYRLHCYVRRVVWQGRRV
jgi:hypothetical protein